MDTFAGITGRLLSRIMRAVYRVEQEPPRPLPGQTPIQVLPPPPSIYGKLDRDLVPGGSATLSIWQPKPDGSGWEDSGDEQTVYAPPTQTATLAAADEAVYRADWSYGKNGPGQWLVATDASAATGHARWITFTLYGNLGYDAEYAEVTLCESWDLDGGEAEDPGTLLFVYNTRNLFSGVNGADGIACYNPELGRYQIVYLTPQTDVTTVDVPVLVSATFDGSALYVQQRTITVIAAAESLPYEEVFDTVPCPPPPS